MSSSYRYTLTKNIKPYQKYIPDLTKPILRTIIQICVNYIESGSCSKDQLERAIQKLENSNHDVPNNFCELFSALLQIIQTYLRYPKGMVKDEELNDTLKDLRFSNECIDDIINVLHHHQESLSLSYCEMRMLRSPPRKMRWRLNITLVEKPTTILHIEKADGTSISIEMTIAMFHRLRFNVASLLNEVQSLEGRASMRRS